MHNRNIIEAKLAIINGKLADITRDFNRLIDEKEQLQRILDAVTNWEKDHE